jgi:putative oxidoreductase
MSTIASNPLVRLTDRSINLLGNLTPILDLCIRLWVARVFWNSGLTKIQSWDTTLMLFEYEYAVPVLPFELAAILATGVELIAPVLLLLGLGTRFGALALFVLNYVAAIAYPDISAAGLKDHYLWGALLAVTFFHGPGAFSVDHFMAKKLRANNLK